MKKLISCILLFALCLSLFAGCGKSEDVDLAKAKELLYTMYKESGLKTTVDYTVVSQIRVGTTTFPITWTADVAEDLVKITKDASGMTLVDVNETPSDDVNYTLTGTLTNAKGETAAVGFKHLIPKALGYKEIVDQAYALEAGKTLDGVYTLKGVISTIDTPWSADYKNITVTINVEGVEGKPIMCYRLKGDGAEGLKVGDTITVKGSLTNYNGTIEYAAGCELLSVVVGNVEQKPGYDPTGKTQDEVIDAAYQLDPSESMLAEATLTGVISSVDTPWSADYKNITVTIKCTGKEDKPIQCFRLKGDGAEGLKAGDTITVKGTLTNYKGAVQFNAGCVVENIVPGEGGSTETTPPATEPAPTTPPATEPAPTNPSVDVPVGNSIVFDFAGLTELSNNALTDENAPAIFNAAAPSAGLVSVKTVKVYPGNNNDSGAYVQTAGLLKLGTSKENGQITLTFADTAKVVKVEIVCHDWYTKSDKYPTNSNTLSVNGSAAVLAPYTEDATAGTLTFTLDGSSNTVVIDTSKNGAAGGRVFIFKIIVSFAK